MEKFSRTKIVCTIGPATESVPALEKLIYAGMDVARLNFSHGDNSNKTQVIENIRTASINTGRPIPIMADLCGPKIRLGELKEPFDVKAGEQLTLVTDDIVGDRSKVAVTYPQLINDVKAGETILVDDGLIKLKVKEVRKKSVVCDVINDGTVKQRKGLNFIDTKLTTPALTDKDKEDALYAIEQKVDIFALSFVRTADDIRSLRAFILRSSANIPIIAKIEKPEAIDNIDSIIDETDMLMVARGDLGVEMPTEDVPILQKMIIAKCIENAVPVITATQMLESMIDNPRPTRAEASDVANAVFDYTDAVMLSAETSVGKYPVETVATMDAIIQRVEDNSLGRNKIVWRQHNFSSIAESLAHSACVLADEAKASAIIVVTRTGRAARILSKYRPSVPIIAFTAYPDVVKISQIYWGVLAESLTNLSDTDSTLDRTKELALSMGMIASGDTVVFITGIPLLEGTGINMLKIGVV